MNLVYNLDQHEKCYNYVSKSISMFTFVTIEKNSFIHKRIDDHNYIFFIIEGSVRVNCIGYKEKIYQAGECVFGHQQADFEVLAIEKTVYLKLRIDSKINLCDRISLQSLYPLMKGLDYQLDALPIRPQLQNYIRFIQLLINDKVMCARLNEIKQQELFLILRSYYSNAELALFFYPMLGASISFKELVYSKYLTVGSSRELAAACGYSERNFQIKFIETFNETPYKWACKQISRHLIYELQDKNKSITQIADELRFSSAAHLTKFCKSQFGETPSALRQKLFEENPNKPSITTSLFEKINPK